MKHFNELNQLGTNFIVDGYMAAAYYYGFQRAMKQIELIMPAPHEFDAPFACRVDSRRFNELLATSVHVDLTKCRFRIIEVTALIEDFRNSSEELKRMDASQISKLVRSKCDD